MRANTDLGLDSWNAQYLSILDEAIPAMSQELKGA